MREVSRFPFAALSPCDRAELRRQRALLRALQPARRTSATRSLLDERWTDVLGASPQCTVLAPQPLTRDEARRRFGNGRSRTAVFELAQGGVLLACIDPPLANALALRALAMQQSLALAAGLALTATLEGALQLLCAQCAVHLCAPSPPPLVRAVTDVFDDALEAQGATRLLAFPMRVQAGVDAGMVMLLVDADKTFATEATTAVPAVMHACAVHASLVIARQSMTVGDVHSLVVGDVLLMDDAIAIDASSMLHGDAVLRMGDVDACVRIQSATRLLLVDVIERRRNTVNENDPAATAPRGLAAALPVDVEVVLTRGTFTVGEVSAWRPGEVIEFSTALTEPVVLRAGGVTIARGELVAVDGNVGVRVTELVG